MTAAALLTPVRAQEGLTVESEIRYEVAPEAGGVHVRVKAHIVNNDPQTEYNPSDSSYYYYVIDFPVPQAAENLKAVDADGKDLRITPRESDSTFWATASIYFADGLFYEDTYDFTLEYDLVSDRASDILITPSYITFPALPAGSDSTVEISVPGAPYKSLVDHPDCKEASPGEYRCATDSSGDFVAWVEVYRPDKVETLTGTAGVEGRQIKVRVSYFAGEEEWAHRVLELFRTGLPVVAELNGHPYDHAGTIEIQEARRTDTGGYAGTATQYCKDVCNIQLLPTSGTVTALHEVAHLWSDIYSVRWISEGMAQVLAEMAAERLGLPVDDRFPELPAQPETDLPLDQWEVPDSLPLPTPEEQRQEMHGYVKSAAFVRLLIDTLGLPAVQQANAAINEGGQPADSRRFMDALEEASGQVLDDLFLEWVFPASEAEVIHARRAAIDRLDALVTEAEEQGLGEPSAVRRALREWDFEAAQALMDDAEAALDQHGANLSYMSEHGLREGGRFGELWKDGGPAEALAFARDQDEAAHRIIAADGIVDGPRNVWERIGLLGTDLEAKVDRARDALAADDPVLADHLAAEALHDHETAARTGQWRAGLAGTVLGVLAAVVIGSLLWYRRRPRPARF